MLYAFGLSVLCYCLRADNWMVDDPTYNETAEGTPHNGLTDFGKVANILTNT